MENLGHTEDFFPGFLWTDIILLHNHVFWIMKGESSYMSENKPNWGFSSETLFNNMAQANTQSAMTTSAKCAITRLFNFL